MLLTEALNKFITPERDKEIKRSKWSDNDWWFLSSYKIYHLTKEDMEADDWEVRQRDTRNTHENT
jgi:hypothetical protein